MNNSSECYDVVMESSITDHYGLTIALSVIFSVLAVYSAVSNVIIILALFRQRRNKWMPYSTKNQGAARDRGSKHLKSSQLLMVSMATADAIIGLISMPLGIYVIAENGSWRLGRAACQAWLWLDKVLCTVSIYHVTLMAFSRYLAVCRPMFHRVVSGRATLVSILVSWAVPVAVSTALMVGGWQHEGVEWLVRCFDLAGTCTPVYNRPYIITVSALDFYIPFLVLFGLYVLIVNTIFKLRRNTSLLGIVSKSTYSGSKVALRTKKPSRKPRKTACINSPINTIERSDLCEMTSINFSIDDFKTPDEKIDSFKMSLSTITYCDNEAFEQNKQGYKGKTITSDFHETKLANGAEHTEKIHAINRKETESRMMSQTVKKTATALHSTKPKKPTENKAFTTIGCVVACFTVCWLPFSIYNFLIVYSQFQMAYWPHLLFTWLGYVNSAMNPIFYCLTDSVRKEVVSLLSIHKGRQK